MENIYMIIQDNVLKAYLKNVYFITGTPCGGKTTISRALARRHGLMVYDADERFPEHQRLADPALQPAMCRRFSGADEFFGRSVAEYRAWLLDNARQQLDFVLLDLIRLAHDRPVLCDCDLALDDADRLTDVSRVAFLIRDPSNLIEDYCDRPDHRDFNDFINSATDVARAKATCNATLLSINAKRCDDIKRSRYFWLERTPDSTVEDTVRRVERHFNW